VIPPLTYARISARPISLCFSYSKPLTTSPRLRWLLQWREDRRSEPKTVIKSMSDFSWFEPLATHFLLEFWRTNHLDPIRCEILEVNTRNNIRSLVNSDYGPAASSRTRRAGTMNNFTDTEKHHRIEDRNVCIVGWNGAFS